MPMEVFALHHSLKCTLRDTRVAGRRMLNCADSLASLDSELNKRSVNVDRWKESTPPVISLVQMGSRTTIYRA